jgi:hydroxymethylpyrimidine pyrophosphatase-like HAD family hydrolase
VPRPIELVVTDLDGTLWGYDSIEQPHDTTLAAWHELERRGIPVLVATGRRATSTREPLAALGLTPSAVVLNGALAIDLWDGTCYHRRHHDVDAAKVVLAAFHAHDLSPCLYVEHPDYDVYVGTSPSTSSEHLAAIGARVCEADLDEIVAGTPVLSFGVFGHDASRLAPVAAALAAHAEARVIADTWSDASGMTVNPVGLSKWVGVLAACERHAIDPGRVLAIGDETNDIELLTAAAIGVAVADAHPGAIAAADHVVGPAAEGGWAQVLDLV